ncbi:MAG: thiolase family protein [Candidatus Cloacimonetes bacterium]|nr:thiolase family protein [Candidatus Cloacimonadota bacterium]
MENVYLISAAMTPFARYTNSSYSGLARPVILQAIQRANLQLKDVEAVFCGNLFGGSLVGQRAVRDLGIGTVPIFNIENACSSSGAALHLAAKAIEAEQYDVVCVLGVDKLSQFGGGPIPMVEEDYEARRGVIMPAVYAMRARRYMYEYNVATETLAAVTVKSRRHANKSPYAQFRDLTSVEEVLASRVIADPITLYQCCPTGDGAAAVIVCSEKIRRQYEGDAVAIMASVVHSGAPTTGYRDMTWPSISEQSALSAYDEANINPTELDIVELHDAFSIAELIYYEALHLCPRGKGGEFLISGKSTYDGDVVVNPSGGLLSRGHPVGATGAAQAAEIYWQLTKKAGNRQVKNARLALSHVTGGGISRLDHGACTVHIYKAA